jgi:RPA family protein
MSGSEPGRREVAYRLFAAEFDDSEFAYSESDEERAPNYVVTPTGARVNRLFAVGVLTELEDVNPEMIRGRVVDPTGAFVTYAGQYQPDALAALERMEPPTFLSISGKARTFEPDDSDQIFTSVRPESVNEVDAETRDRWVLTAAERTRERIGVMASAIKSGLVGDQLRAALVDAGVDDRLADGVALAFEYYGTTPAYLAALDSLALDAVRVVAGETDEVGNLDVAPGEGAGDATALATLDLSGAPSPETAAAAAEMGEAGAAESDSAAGSDTDDEPPSSETDIATASESSPETAGVADPDVDAAPDTTGISDTTAETEPDSIDSASESATGHADEEAEKTHMSADSTEVTAEDSTDTAVEPTDSGEEPIDATVEPTDTGEESTEAVPDDFDPGEFELDEEERREVEDEFGTEFSTADEVESADIEPDSATEEPEQSADSDAVTSDSSTGDDTGEPAPSEEDTDADASADAATADEEPDDVDLETAVMETMKELDDGDGADEADLVSTIAEAHGADTDAISAAIEDALMSGQCYEPTDGTLKPI